LNRITASLSANIFLVFCWDLLNAGGTIKWGGGMDGG
jgi:hypothetical protein